MTPLWTAIHKLIINITDALRYDNQLVKTISTYRRSRALVRASQHRHTWPSHVTRWREMYIRSHTSK